MQAWPRPPNSTLNTSDDAFVNSSSRAGHALSTSHGGVILSSVKINSGSHKAGQWCPPQPPNRLPTANHILDVIDESPAYTLLCEQFRNIGLVLDRTTFARSVLAAATVDWFAPTADAEHERLNSKFLCLDPEHKQEVLQAMLDCINNIEARRHTSISRDMDTILQPISSSKDTAPDFCSHAELDQSPAIEVEMGTCLTRLDPTLDGALTSSRSILVPANEPVDSRSLQDCCTVQVGPPISYNPHFSLLTTTSGSTGQAHSTNQTNAGMSTVSSRTSLSAQPEPSAPRPLISPAPLPLSSTLFMRQRFACRFAPICTMTFASTGELSHHERRPHCSDCPQTFDTTDQCSLHQERPHCSSCSESFATTPELTQHKKLHCQFCSKKLGRPAECRRHERFHCPANHTKEEFPCRLCEYVCTSSCPDKCDKRNHKVFRVGRRDKMIDHWRTVHEEEYENMSDFFKGPLFGQVSVAEGTNTPSIGHQVSYGTAQVAGQPARQYQQHEQHTSTHNDWFPHLRDEKRVTNPLLPPHGTGLLNIIKRQLSGSRESRQKGVGKKHRPDDWDRDEHPAFRDAS